MTSLSMLYFQKQIFVRKPISPALVIKHIFAKLEQGDALHTAMRIFNHADHDAGL